MNEIEQKMRCGKCQGRTFLDRVFSDNLNFETSCILCGKREFIDKSSEVGQWLTQQESDRRVARSLSQ